MTLNTTFKNTFAIHPGETLLECLSAIGMSQKELSIRLGITEKTISEIINGKANISPETSTKLEKVLGIPTSFWNNLQRNYDEVLATNKSIIFLQNEKPLFQPLKNLYNELINKNWIDDLSKDDNLDKDEKELIKINSFLNYFGISSFNQLEELYNFSVAFRKSPNKDISRNGLLAWLRKGEIDSLKIDANNFDKQKLIDSLPYLRKLTIEKEDLVWSSLVNCLKDCGVCLVYASHLKNVPVNGVTRWFSDRVLIQISDYRKKTDIFWFTLFHEIGHVLQVKRSEIFIDTYGETDDSKLEKDADSFATEQLIPSNDYNKFTKSIQDSKFSDISNKIKEFAKDMEIPNAIVAGRLAKDPELPKINFQSVDHLRPSLNIIFS